MSKTTEDKIQELIRQRVLEEYNRRQAAEEIKLQSEATIEALHDVTGIPREEIQRIADHVRAEISGEPERQPVFTWLKAHGKHLLAGFLLLLLLLLLSNTPLVDRFSSQPGSLLQQHYLSQPDANRFPEEVIQSRESLPTRHFRRRHRGGN